MNGPLLCLIEVARRHSQLLSWITSMSWLYSLGREVRREKVTVLHERTVSHCHCCVPVVCLGSIRFSCCDVTTSLLLEHTRFTRFWPLSNSLVFSSIGIINFIFWLVTECNWITVHSSHAYLRVLHASVCAICTTWLWKYNLAIFCE